MRRYFMVFLLVALLFPSLTWAKEVQEKHEDLGYKKIVGEIETLEKDRFLIKDSQEGEIIILYKGSKVLNLKTGEFVEENTFKEGQKVIIFIRNNTPYLQSLPPQVNPQLIAISPGEYNVEMDYFNEEGESIENRLTIVGTENTKIVHLNGKEKSAKVIKNQQLIVLYKASTRSIPPQTNPEKIIIWKDIKQSLTEGDFLNPLLFGGEQKGFPLRKIFEGVGVEVTWNQDTREIGLNYEEKEGKISTKDKIYILGDEEMALDFFEIKSGTSYLTRESIEKIWEGLK